MPYKSDTETTVFFYEQEFYCLSNFSAFRVKWEGLDFDTSEHAYQWEKFNDPGFDPFSQEIQWKIIRARSAHDAFKIAEAYRTCIRPHWSRLKVESMRDILRAKLDQHEYVRRKLLETGNRVLIEDSWRDNFWGWGEGKQGNNQLGKLWMQLREEYFA